MRIINIVDRLDRVNFGIWNAAIATVRNLQENHGIASEIWFPEETREAAEEELNGARPRGLPALDRDALEAAVLDARLDPARDVIVSHGCWQYPTRWGQLLKRRGYAWLAVPHGMLEAWSLSQKRIRKILYFHVLEKRALLLADRIRAVGQPERVNLRKVFGERVVWIPNGVPSRAGTRNEGVKANGRIFLFMARLHHKKGIIPLLEAWKASSLADRTDCELKIAGPDDGELVALERFLKENKAMSNVRYLGPVYGDEKAKLLQRSHFYVLPSHSEGFPTSVLEAMQAGMVPIITPGCNFPEAIEAGPGIAIRTDVPSIQAGLEQALALKDADYATVSRLAVELIESRYTHSRIAEEQAELHWSLLPSSRDA